MIGLQAVVLFKSPFFIDKKNVSILERDKMCLIIAEKGNYYRIFTNDNIGWISKECVDVVS